MRRALLSAALALLPAAAGALPGEGSFTPSSVILPVLELGLYNRNTGATAPLYTCTPGGTSSCLVDVTDQIALSALVASPTAAPAGVYDSLYVRNCRGAGSFPVVFQGAVSLGGTLYHTAAGADPLSAGPAAPGPVTVSFSGCVATYPLATRLTLASGATEDLSLFFTPLDLGWAKLGAATAASGCAQDPAAAHSACLNYPGLLPALSGAGAPTLERYFIFNPSFQGVGEVFLVAASTNGPLLAGTPRRFYNDATVGPVGDFDDRFIAISDNGDGTWTLKNIGSTLPGSPNYFAFPRFARVTHFDIYYDAVPGASVPYGAYRDYQVTLPHCPTDPSRGGRTARLLNFSPVALDSSSPPMMRDFLSIEPLGNLNPTHGHIFPTDHQYFYLKPDPAAPGSTLMSGSSAPATGWITKILEVRQTPPTGPSPQYRPDLAPCREFDLHYDHQVALAPALMAAFSAAPAPASGCTTSVHGSGAAATTTVTCERAVMLPVSAGELLANVGGGPVLASDIQALDANAPPLNFANPARFPVAPNGMDELHVVCAFDYLSSAPPLDLYDTYQRFFAAYRGPSSLTPSTATPPCGTFADDVANTALGNWHPSTSLSASEDASVALVHDDATPSVGAFSIGGSALPSLAANVYEFTPSTDLTRMINVRFDLMIVDPRSTSPTPIACYEGLTPRLPLAPPGGVLLLQLTSPTTLRFEARSAAGCAALPAPWAFTSPATFYR